MREAWGCTEETKMASPTEMQEGEELLRFRNCPVKFIPASVTEFAVLYRYHKEFPSAKMPSYANLSMRFRKAWQVYQSSMSSEE